MIGEAIEDIAAAVLDDVAALFKRFKGGKTMVEEQRLKRRFQCRQGDVFIEEVAELPKGAHRLPRDRGRVVLAYGEATGHAHAIEDPGVEIFETALDGDNVVYLNVPERARVVHEEHDPIELAPGKYRVARQREYDEAEYQRWIAD